jgi:heme A synthase
MIWSGFSTYRGSADVHPLPVARARRRRVGVDRGDGRRVGRLTDAGLGCPDWPGCYGQLFVTEQLALEPGVEENIGRPLEAGKAWREMFHRYLASTLGLICVALAVVAWLNRRDPDQPWRVPLALVALVIFQGLLGMWTVTLLLKPIIVVAHLLGGFATCRYCSGSPAGARLRS